jgi:hypothetical protein
VQYEEVTEARSGLWISSEASGTDHSVYAGSGCDSRAVLGDDEFPMD